MLLQEHFKQAIANLTASKLRSILAALGILVGTASVVALVSSGQLATQKALEQFKSLGTNLMSLTLYQSGKPDGATDANTLDEQETEQMETKINPIHDVAPYTTIYTDLTFNGKKISGGVIGASEHLHAAIKITLKQGRFVSFLDKYSRFCVLGNGIYKQIHSFDKSNLIGKQITLGKEIFTIVGIASPWQENSFFNEDINKSVIIPISTSSLVSKYSKINNIVLMINPNSDITAVQNSIRKYLSKAAPDLNIFFRSARQIINSMQTQNNIFTLLLGLIGGISLLVGGIGVMNVMLVSVAERRREIGIRMAIGAKRKDIQLLFLIEAIVLALFGGIVGVILGVVLSLVIGYFAGWGLGIFILPVIIGFLVSASTGIFFGFYPAYRASRLDPITTLRYD